MKKPNFFIIGAPKCGTTSLADWLSEHPQIYMPPIKEPMFFNSDFGEQGISNLQEYESLFELAGDKHVAVGEASTFYLNSEVAISKILDYSPDSKFIVLLRKPSDMVISLHAQVCRGLENQRDFSKAWQLQYDRSKGKNLPPFVKYPELYQYGERCKVGTQIKRLFDLVPRERVLVQFLEEIRDSPETHFNQVLKFLGVSHFRPDGFEIKNARVQIKYAPLKFALNVVGYIKDVSGIKVSTGTFSFINKFNLKKSENAKIPEEMLDELEGFFAEEISLIEEEVGRVPVEWMR